MFVDSRRTFIISDLHFFHTNIIKYCDRPFKDIEEMNKVLIDNWNSIVEKDDLIVVVGDFVFGSTDNLEYITNSLNGRILLVRGNHDRHSVTKYARFGIEVRNNVLFGHKGVRYLIKHRPVHNHDSFDYEILVHGHTHSIHKYSDVGINTSVEALDYKPILFSELVENYKIG